MLYTFIFEQLQYIVTNTLSVVLVQAYNISNPHVQVQQVAYFISESVVSNTLYCFIITSLCNLGFLQPVTFHYLYFIFNADVMALYIFSFYLKTEALLINTSPFIIIGFEMLLAVNTLSDRLQYCGIVSGHPGQCLSRTATGEWPDDGPIWEKVQGCFLAPVRPW